MNQPLLGRRVARRAQVRRCFHIVLQNKNTKKEKKNNKEKKKKTRKREPTESTESIYMTSNTGLYTNTKINCNLNNNIIIIWAQIAIN